MGQLCPKLPSSVSDCESNSSCNTETIAMNSNLTSTNRTNVYKNEMDELHQNHASHCETQVKCNLDLAGDSQNASSKCTHAQTTLSKSLKCVALNVSGLNTKLLNGVLDQYLSQFDIVSLVEMNTDSPILSETLFNSYSCFSMKKSNPNRKYKYGGIHGLCVCVSPTFKENVEIVPDTVSECTLWLKIESGKTMRYILGALYIPCDGSRFYFDEIFDQIESDILI